MAFSSDDFGPLSGLLFVSVARGSAEETGQPPKERGALYALDCTGAVVASLDTRDMPDFEPRALNFVGDGRLLTGDLDRILVARVDDFVFEKVEEDQHGCNGPSVRGASSR